MTHCALEDDEDPMPLPFEHLACGQGPVSGSGGTGSESAPSPTAYERKAATFSLMLRRADNVPVGLHVQGGASEVH